MQEIWEKKAPISPSLLLFLSLDSYFKIAVAAPICYHLFHLSLVATVKKKKKRSHKFGLPSAWTWIVLTNYCFCLPDKNKVYLFAIKLYSILSIDITAHNYVCALEGWR